MRAYVTYLWSAAFICAAKLETMDAISVGPPNRVHCPKMGPTAWANTNSSCINNGRRLQRTDKQKHLRKIAMIHLIVQNSHSTVIELCDEFQQSVANTYLWTLCVNRQSAADCRCHRHYHSYWKSKETICSVARQSHSSQRLVTRFNFNFHFQFCHEKRE